MDEGFPALRVSFFFYRKAIGELKVESGELKVENSPTLHFQLSTLIFFARPSITIRTDA